MAYDLTSKLYTSELLTCPILAKIRKDNALKAAADALVKAQDELTAAEAVRDVLEHKRRELNRAVEDLDAQVRAAVKRVQVARDEFAREQEQ